ncbi:hypothetical protein GCM10010124_16150 [Pilimelia terevasa]|uniref:Uncharacterized protein n=2 Tax=Pilimelia terevasa TaxID=53372 RepID=A0A8J3BID0_9ACTN|nr:hypothetical protein GCM10010124_16150 [Pilimelia terevasa]
MNRQLKISFLVTVAVVVALVVVLIAADVDFPIGLGAPLGIGIGLLLTLPGRRLLAELGLTAAEARSVLQGERQRRSGVADLPRQVRYQREVLRARIWLAVGLVAAAVFVVAALYFFGAAGQTHEEDAPTNVWLGVSFFAGAIALILTPSALLQARSHRETARSFEQSAASARRSEPVPSA